LVIYFFDKTATLHGPVNIVFVISFNFDTASVVSKVSDGIAVFIAAVFIAAVFIAAVFIAAVFIEVSYRNLGSSSVISKIK